MPTIEPSSGFLGKPGRLIRARGEGKAKYSLGNVVDRL
jgi:hypothetical protein